MCNKVMNLTTIPTYLGYSLMKLVWLSRTRHGIDEELLRKMQLQ